MVSIISGGGSHQKWKPEAMRSMWKKFNDFVWNVHIFFAKLPGAKGKSHVPSTWNAVRIIGLPSTVSW